MKKYIISILALVLAVQVSEAQISRDSLIVNRRFIDNTFVSTSMGVSGTWTTRATDAGFGYPSMTFDVSLGKWLTPQFGVRLGYQGHKFIDWETDEMLLPGVNYSKEMHDGAEMNMTRFDFNYVHFDALWNIQNTFLGYNSKRFYSTVPYIHIGYQWTTNSFAENPLIKRDYKGGVGVLNNFRINERINFFADVRAAFDVRHTVNLGDRDVTSRAISVYGLFGASYNFADTGWHKIGKTNQPGYAVNKFMENTFVGMNAGLYGYWAPGENLGFNAVFSPGVEAYVGKWFSPNFGARVSGGWNNYTRWTDRSNTYGLTVDEAYDNGTDVIYRSRFAFAQIRGDFMWNITNNFMGVDPKRIWDVIPYFAAGIGYEFNPEDSGSRRFDFFSGIGVINTFRVSERVSINLDLRALHLSERPYTMTNKHDAITPSVTLGATYNIRPGVWKYIDPQIPWKYTPFEQGYGEGYILNERAHDNVNVNLSAGVNVLFNPGAGLGANARVAPGMELTVTKWLTPGIGFRLGALGMRASQFGTNPGGNVEAIPSVLNGKAAYAEQAGIFYPHIDMMFNAINLFKYNPDRKYDIAPYASVGYMMTFSTNTDRTKMFDGAFGVGGGVYGSYRIGQRAAVNLDLKATAVEGKIFGDNIKGNAIMASGLVGFAYDFGRTDWVHSSQKTARRAPGEKGLNKVGYVLNTRFIDNTFINFDGGIIFPIDGSLPKGRGWTPSGSVAINAGKWFTPYFGIRLGYQGIALHQNGYNPASTAVFTPGVEGELKREKVNYNYYHIDFMGNVNNIGWAYNDTRIYEAVPYLTAGVNTISKSVGGKSYTNVAVGVGLLNNFRINNRLALHADLKAVTLNGRMLDSNSGGTAIAASAMIGMSYNFGRYGWRVGVVPYEKLDDDDVLRNEKVRYWAVSTNVLGYADFGTINAEVQYALNRHFSLSSQAKVNAWVYGKDPDKELMNKKSVVSLGVKYWPWYVYSGWWARPFIQTEGYTYANLYKNMPADRGNLYGVGVSIGYSLLINKWFNIDFGAGLWGGYQTYAKYENASMKTITQSSSQAFIKPAEVSVAAMFVF